MCRTTAAVAMNRPGGWVAAGPVSNSRASPEGSGASMSGRPGLRRHPSGAISSVML